MMGHNLDTFRALESARLDLFQQNLKKTNENSQTEDICEFKTSDLGVIEDLASDNDSELDILEDILEKIQSKSEKKRKLGMLRETLWFVRSLQKLRKTEDLKIIEVQNESKGGPKRVLGMHRHTQKLRKLFNT